MRRLITAVLFSTLPMIAHAKPVKPALNSAIVKELELASFSELAKDFTKKIQTHPQEVRVDGSVALLRVKITQPDNSPLDLSETPVAARYELKGPALKNAHAEIYLTKTKEGWKVVDLTSALEPNAGVTADLCIEFSTVIDKGVCEGLGWSKAWQTPARGSELRKELLDAVRPQVAKDFGDGIEFVVNSMRVVKDRAFLRLGVQRPGGEPINMEQTPLAKRMEAFGGADAEALLKKVNGIWVAEYVVTSPTDVWWADSALCKSYGALLTHCTKK